MLEKKEMSKSRWKRVIESKYEYEYLEECKGMVSVLHLKKLTSPCYKEYNGKILKIADDGYCWLQFAIDCEKWWLTAMFDEIGNLVQYYIDITSENTIKKDGTAYFYDLFLDVVCINDGEIILLDKDELDKALEDNVITQQEYENAYIVAQNIIKKLKSDKKRLDEFCNIKLNNFKNKNSKEHKNV